MIVVVLLALLAPASSPSDDGAPAHVPSDGAAAPHDAPAEVDAPASDDAPALYDGATPDAPTAAGATMAARPLDRGLALLDALDVEAAHRALEEALSAGPYRYDDTVALYAGLGTARAYLDDEDGALAAFTTLLTIAPGHDLPYTTSPKATFVFERARRALQDARALEIALVAPPVVRFDAPIELALERRHDTSGLVTAARVLVREKGAGRYDVHVVDMSAGRGALVLPAIPAASAVDESGQEKSGVLLEVAVIGVDARGWEVFRGPAPERPLEIPVGFDAPGPWYTAWWVYAGAAASAALVAAAITGVVGATFAALSYRAPDVPVTATPRSVP